MSDCFLRFKNAYIADTCIHEIISTNIILLNVLINVYAVLVLLPIENLLFSEGLFYFLI